MATNEEKMEAIAEGDGPIMGGFAVVPIKDCPHTNADNIAENFSDVTVGLSCKDCEHNMENWVCLKCKVIGCSRYV